MAFDSKAFITDILKDVQIDDATKDALSSIVENPQVARRLEESTLRQSEFSKLASTYQEKIKGAQDYWDSLAKWKQDEEARLAAERPAPAGTGNTVHDTAEYDKKLQQLAQESLQYMNTLSTVQMRHFKEFGEVLDPQELIKQATKDKVSIDIAYDRLVQPKRNEIQQTDIARQIEEARKQGAEEAIKNYKIPSIEAPISGGVPHALDRFIPENKSEYGPMAAVKAFTADRLAGRNVG